MKSFRRGLVPLVLFVACTSTPSGTTTTPSPSAPVPVPVVAVAVVEPIDVVPVVAVAQVTAAAPIAEAEVAAVIAAVVKQHGEAERARIERGVRQVAALWRADDDGDAATLTAFAVEQFATSGAALDALFARLSEQFEQVDGLGYEMTRSLRWHSDVDTGANVPVDGLLAAYDPSAGMTDAMFASKLGFAVLLNFPLTTVDERARDGATWSRRTWAEVRLAQRFDTRIPADIVAEAHAVEAAADAYISDYNLWMHHVLDATGQRVFPAGKRLISHWNLRDELKAQYGNADGLTRQRLIATVMERIVTQSIPAAVIDNPRVDWNPVANTVVAAAVIEPDAPVNTRPIAPSPAPEPNRRFEFVLAHAAAGRRADPFSPTAPSVRARAFAGAEMSEARVRDLLEAILAAPEIVQAAAVATARLGRPLEPHDLWFEFSQPAVSEAHLDALTRRRYPSAPAFAKDLPRILGVLGFSRAEAQKLARNIEVDPSRGAGHAMPALRRGDKPHLRTRVEAGGMDYKGYNIAIHELGHNVEQYYSLYEVDHVPLAGVPAIAFTEAMAFLFQRRDLAVLGQPAPADAAAANRDHVLDDLWNTWEIAGSALVEIDVWRWLDAHPTATAGDLRDATVAIAREVWDRYYAKVLGGRGQTSLLGIYSHTISSPLYLFNYVLGHVIAFGVEEAHGSKAPAAFAREFRRIARLGRITPDQWMQAATGGPVSAAPLLAAARRVLAPQAPAR